MNFKLPRRHRKNFEIIANKKIDENFNENESKEIFEQIKNEYQKAPNSFGSNEGRKESYLESQYAREISRKFGIGCKILTWNEKKPATSIMQKAREIRYKKITVAFEKKLKNHSWLIFKLKEGKNREIRNICNYFSWNIVKLVRIGYGPYKLGRLKEGQFQKLNSISK